MKMSDDQIQEFIAAAIHELNTNPNLTPEQVERILGILEALQHVLNNREQSCHFYDELAKTLAS